MTYFYNMARKVGAEMVASAVALALAGPGGWADPATARAQTARDAIKQHLKAELDRSKEKQKEKREREEEAARREQEAKKRPPAKAARPPAKPAAPARKPDPGAGRAKGAGGEQSADQKPDGKDGKAPEAEESKLPLRVIGKDLLIDIKLGAGYRGWVPQQYPAVDVEMAGYLTWTVNVKAKIFRWLAIRKAYYESNGLAGPRTESAAMAAEIVSYAPKAAWFFGVLGFPYFKVWEPVVSYESRAFDTVARPREPGVCLVTADFEGDLAQCVPTVDRLRLVSSFETFVAGVRYNHNRDPSPVIKAPKGSVPPLFFGLGLMSYAKPYQVTVDGATLEGLLFDGRFRGVGLAFGTELGGGAYRFYAEVDLQVGLGEISLTRDMTLNELAPEGWLIGYLHGNATVGYRLPLWKFAPTVMFVPAFTGGGASFFFFETEPEPGERGTTPAINWDFLWSVSGSLVTTL